MLQQRLAHKPLDKIIGRREFYKANFVVNENVLSPRPDTEILVEEAIKLLPDTAVEILDLGTGSGCIIESILAEKPQARGVAVDISAAALQTARLNAENLQLTTRLDFVNADWFAPDFCAEIGKKFDMIVSNPPYIPTADIATLAAEVKNYDPAAALDGGADGYDSYRRISELAPELLQNGGYILLEAGIGQAEKIADIFCNHKLKLINIVPDLNGISRCIILQK
jgi:release factor glutamine methyltransferase